MSPDQKVSRLSSFLS